MDVDPSTKKPSATRYELRRSIDQSCASKPLYVTLAPNSHTGKLFCAESDKFGMVKTCLNLPGDIMLSPGP